ncbi:hypothetical protein ScPMuIL_006020 [Solemya velum]
MSAEEGWAQLVSVTDVESAPIAIVKDKITIGRAKECDISLDENKLVSSKHCFVERDRHGKVWLTDTSTNGTLLNLSSRVSKGNKKELHHGDEFYIVYKKNDTELNIGYMYQDMEELQKEELLQTQENSSDDEDILDATVVDSDINAVESSPEKRRRSGEETVTSEPTCKRQKRDCDSPSTTPTTNQGTEEETQISEKGIRKSGSKTQVTLDEDSKTKSSIPAIDKKNDTKDEKDSNSTPTCVFGKDELEEALICIICQEIMHDCISLQPCMHSFCAGCYSGWMDRSNVCPSCRKEVERINKNHIVNNLIDAYLKAHPAKKRDDKEIKELEAKNKITRDMLYPKQTELESGSEDYEDSDDEPLPTTTIFPTPAPAPVLFGLGTPLFGVRPATVCRSCRGYTEPPTPVMGVIGGITTAAINIVKNMIGGNTDTGGAGDTGATAGTTTAGTTTASTTTGTTNEIGGETPGPSTTGGNDGKLESKKDPDEKIMPDPPAFICNANQNHILCACCFQPMPDRRYDYGRRDDVPAQQCTVCWRSFCHNYWGCRKADCTGCLAKFSELNFTKKCLPNLILDNAHESNIFKTYLESEQLSVREVLTTCLQKLDSGAYSCPDQARFRISSTSILCYACGLRNFKELAYSYRRDIHAENLPPAVTARADCYWGRNCRTQRNKPHHAVNFNHICEQTRKS